MKLWLPLALGLLGLATPALAASEGTKFFVQVIEGTNDKKPPTAEGKPIGPKLSQKLSQVFRWEYYWEIERKEIAVQPNEVKKLKLDGDRWLEIEATDEKHVDLRLFRGKELVRKSRHLSDLGMMAVLGGTKTPDKAWFAVVRRDRPRSATASR